MFQIGDRVKIKDGQKSIGGFTITDEVCACPATVIYVNHDDSEWPYGIAFDKSVSAHGCDGHAPMGHGLWVNETNIELYESEVSSIEEGDLMEVLLC